MSNENEVVWTHMSSQSLWMRAVWYLDKRLFRWNHLPALAQLDIIRKSYLLLIVLPMLDKILSPIFMVPDGLRIGLDVGWVTVLPEGSRFAIEVGIPFT